MQEDRQDRRAGDRRGLQQPFAGPERRIRHRRLPDKAPVVRPDLALLSDIDLSRAFQRGAANPDAAEAMRAELERRGLSV